MKITMLGTGNALVTECYNTCFILSDEGRNFLVDTGGGNTILSRIKRTGLSLDDIHDVFISHSHIDHLLGVIWVIRISAQMMNKGIFNGNLNIYSNDDVIPLINDLAEKLLLPYQYNFIGKRIHLRTVSHNETVNIIGHEVKFFDVKSPRTKQLGFVMTYDSDKRLVFCGDEPLRESSRPYAEGCEWLLHEAFCLEEDEEKFSAHEKYHSTVKDTSETAQSLNVKNLLLYHTEDSDLPHRKERYTAEAKRYFNGNIFVPDDLETLTL